jgi:hypothetical protein
MEAALVLDVVEKLFNAAGHPDVVRVHRYGGGQSRAGVAITYQSGSSAYLSSAGLGNSPPVPYDLPAELPSLRFRAQHALKFLLELLDAARPAPFAAWRPVAFADTALKPTGVEIRGKDGTTAYLLVTSGSGPTKDPDEDPYPDYVIPAITIGS